MFSTLFFKCMHILNLNFNIFHYQFSSSSKFLCHKLFTSSFTFEKGVKIKKIDLNASGLKAFLWKNTWDFERHCFWSTRCVNLLTGNTCLIICLACQGKCSLALFDGDPGGHVEDVQVCIKKHQIMVIHDFCTINTGWRWMKNKEDKFLLQWAFRLSIALISESCLR